MATISDVSLYPILGFLLIIAVVFYSLVTYWNRREHKRFLKGNIQVFTTTYNIDEVYDVIIKQVEEWRRYPYKPKGWKYASLRIGVPRFFTFQNEQPRLYSLLDRYAGVMTFELTPIEDGGTSIRITHSPGSEVLIRIFKGKIPIKTPSSIGKTCPNCKRILPPTYTHCPYCAIALP